MTGPDSADPADQADLRRDADALASADALLITAGAGLGVDSGLPDFRGDHGFWKAYPPYERLGLRFVELADPVHFAEDPPLAWGFYGHRRNLYRATAPHAGFAILLRWARRMPRGAFVFTSNVDGHFARAGFDPDRIVEVHGAIDWQQCTAHCGAGIFPAGPATVPVDETTMRAVGPLPACPRCGALARPNILMFGDGHWDPDRTSAQETRLRRWLKTLPGASVVVVECGAGTAIPTVRAFSERVADASGGTLIRINPREPEVRPRHVGLGRGSLDALRALDAVFPPA